MDSYNASMVRFIFLVGLVFGLNTTVTAQTIRYGMVGFPAAAGNPFSMVGPSGTMIWSGLFDALTLLESDGTLEPALALSWEQDDALTWRFNLRRNVFFSDGSILDATAVAASLNWLLTNEGRITDVGKELTNLARAETISPYEVVIHLREIDAILPIRMSLPLIVEPRKWAELGPEGFAQNPVGTGSYAVDEWSRTGRPLRMMAAPQTWRPPVVEEIIVTVIPQAVSRMQALLTGQIDMVESIAFDDINVLREAGLTVMTSPTSQVMALGLINVDAPDSPLNDVRVRQALNYAVDKETIAMALTAGITTPTAQAAVPGMLGYDPDLEPFSFDPDRARALLASAGYSDGFPLVIEVVVGGFIPADEVIYLRVAEDLRNIGIDVTLRAIPIQVYYGKYNSDGGWGDSNAFGASFQGRPFGDPLRAMRRFSCLAFTTYFCEPTLIPLLKAAKAAPTIEERERILRAIAHSYKDTAAALFLVQQAEVIGVSPKLKNVRRRNRTLVLHEVGIAEQPN